MEAATLVVFKFKACSTVDCSHGLTRIQPQTNNICITSIQQEFLRHVCFVSVSHRRSREKSIVVKIFFFVSCRESCSGMVEAGKNLDSMFSCSKRHVKMIITSFVVSDVTDTRVSNASIGALFTLYGAFACQIMAHSTSRRRISCQRLLIYLEIPYSGKLTTPKAHGVVMLSSTSWGGLLD